MSLLADLRSEFHRRLFADVMSASTDKSGNTYWNIADSGNLSSRAISASIVQIVGHPTSVVNPPEQARGQRFAEQVNWFLTEAFKVLIHLRPGTFRFSTAQTTDGIMACDQYEHLKILSRFVAQHKELRSTLGGEYLIKPDIVILKDPFSDHDINQQASLVGGDTFGTHSPLRASQDGKPTLHASVSCKWTMRSDRAQNVRTEALNLIRNRKGQLPRIVAVTFEPLPTRLVSIAIGTGDLDCTYHAALPELQASLTTLKNQDQAEVLDDLIVGRRIRDISDLPLDLVI